MRFAGFVGICQSGPKWAIRSARTAAVGLEWAGVGRGASERDRTSKGLISLGNLAGGRSWPVQGAGQGGRGKSDVLSRTVKITSDFKKTRTNNDLARVEQIKGNVRLSAKSDAKTARNGPFVICASVVTRRKVGLLTGLTDRELNL